LHEVQDNHGGWLSYDGKTFYGVPFIGKNILLDYADRYRQLEKHVMTLPLTMSHLHSMRIRNAGNKRVTARIFRHHGSAGDIAGTGSSAGTA
jgi:hypothetical protein